MAPKLKMSMSMHSWTSCCWAASTHKLLSMHSWIKRQLAMQPDMQTHTTTYIQIPYVKPLSGTTAWFVCQTEHQYDCMCSVSIWTSTWTCCHDSGTKHNNDSCANCANFVALGNDMKHDDTSAGDHDVHDARVGIGYGCGYVSLVSCLRHIVTLLLTNMECCGVYDKCIEQCDCLCWICPPDQTCMNHAAFVILCPSGNNILIMSVVCSGGTATQKFKQCRQYGQHHESTAQATM